MTTALLVTVFAVLLFLALLVQGNREQSARGRAHRKSARVSKPCPHLVHRIFSGEDYGFIAKTGSRQMKEFYELERRKVALFWLRQISQDARSVMRAHALASRQAKHLRPSVEVMLILYYMDLRLTCACLAILIWMFGARGFGYLAAHASQMSGRVDQILANAAKMVQVAPPENPAAF